MLRAPLVLALCCAITITAASPLTEENINKANLKQPQSDTEASVLNSTTDQVDISESNNAGTNVITKQKTDGQESEDVSDWWDTICNDPANDAKTSQNKNEENIKFDEYDTRLRNMTGCDTETMESSSSVGWAALSKRKPELWLAVRVLEANAIAHISCNLGNNRDVYFAVSSMGHTLARNTYLTSDDLSRFQQATNITPQEYRQHYIPMYFKLEDDDLKWRVGCGNRVYAGVVENLNMTGVTYIVVAVDARDYPLKILFNCPPQTSRQHTNIQGLPDCSDSVMMKQISECMRKLKYKTGMFSYELDCESVTKSKNCYFELPTKMRACDDKSIHRMGRRIGALLEPLLQVDYC